MTYTDATPSGQEKGSFPGLQTLGNIDKGLKLVPEVAGVSKFMGIFTIK